MHEHGTRPPAPAVPVSPSQDRVPTLSGDHRVDWALWALSQVLREIAARQQGGDEGSETGEVAA